MTEQKIEQKTEPTKALTEHQLKLLANHVLTLATVEESDCWRMSLHADMLPVDVMVTEGQYYLNGRGVGNVHGAAKEYARLVFESL